MTSAVIILAVVVAVAAEAPYHLPRPAPHSPSFGYPSGPVHLPPSSYPSAPFPQLPQPRPAPQPFPQPAPAPQPTYNPTNGYHYQQPSFVPGFVHPTPQPPSQPIPGYHSPPPIHLPALQPQRLPIAYPQPRPLPVTYPHPQPISIPQPSYGLPQPHPQPQLQPQPQPQPQPFPNYSYNLPQAPAVPITPFFAPTLPQPQSYAYQQHISQPRFSAPLPLQSQLLTNNALSSYQADSNQYSAAQAQTHSEALDQTVVNRVQNIIRDNEHTSAKNAGYLSLVSGVSLESAKPSIEISSFIENSPQSEAELIDIRSGSSAVQPSSPSVSSGYDAPTSAGQARDSSARFGFLPNNNPGITYGVPN